LKKKKISASEAYGQFLRLKTAANQGRNADRLRSARSKAYLLARAVPGCTDQEAIAATNAAEIEVRLAMGVTGELDTSKPAGDFPHFPSDIRSLDHWNPSE